MENRISQSEGYLNLSDRLDDKPDEQVYQNLSEVHYTGTPEPVAAKRLYPGLPPKPMGSFKAHPSAPRAEETNPFLSRTLSKK